MRALYEAQQDESIPGKHPLERPDQSSDPPPHPVVGIGASAGGLRALQALFAHMPPASGMTFVVIVHLSPQHKSYMPELLQAVTSIPVSQVTEAITIAPNHIYVIPPAKHLVIADGELRLREPQQADRRAPIDVFFRTLAETYGSRAAGIVLSGAGSNGTLGLARIKQNGGVTLVQDPLEAEHDSMPQNAIAAGVVDLVLPAAEMPEKLAGYWQSGELQPTAAASPCLSAKSDSLDQILAILRTRAGYDFTAYKREFVRRRAAHHMRVMGQADMAAYLKLLSQHPLMVEALARELLIDTTDFFRDGGAFAALQAQVVPKLFADKPTGQRVRAWVPGCATGQEAFSIAMLLCEYAAGQAAVPQIQVFATDIHERAIAVARGGRYPKAISADVSPERLRRFFVRENQHYHVQKALRDMVIFAYRNVLRDPPISKLNLISCRNVLIYLAPDAQMRLLRVFHYALRPGGYLFLGAYDSADRRVDLFAPIDKQHSLFVRRDVAAQLPLDLISPRTNTR